VRLDRAHRDEQLRADLGVAAVPADQRQDLGLAGRDARVAQPSIVTGLVEAASAAGATTLKPATKSLWGFGVVVQAPDGMIVTLASSTKKDDGPATLRIDDVVLQLGCADVGASKRFYVDRGLAVSKSLGARHRRPAQDSTR
jgi:hypothetical protein